MNLEANLLDLLERIESGRVLARAAEIDPDAWAAPLYSRMRARRERSYKAALREVLATTEPRDRWHIQDVAKTGRK